MQIISDNWDVSFGGVHKHLEGKNWKLHNYDINISENKQDIRVRTFAGPFRTFASNRIRPFPSMGPKKVATFCSITPKPSPAIVSPLGPRP